jgi:hypothetical protein
MQESLKVVDNVLIHSPEAIIVVVSTNGHDDVFTEILQDCQKNRIIGIRWLLIALVLEPIYQALGKTSKMIFQLWLLEGTVIL